MENKNQEIEIKEVEEEDSNQGQHTVAFSLTAFLLGIIIGTLLIILITVTNM